MIEANHFVTFSKYSFDAPMPSLVSLTQSSPQIFDKIQTAVFTIFAFLVKCFVNTNCHNPRTCTDSNMKLRPLSKLEKRITVLSEGLMQRHFLWMLSLINLGYTHEVIFTTIDRIFTGYYKIFTGYWQDTLMRLYSQLAEYFCINFLEEC